MSAVPAYHDRQVLPDGTIVEMKIREAPEPIAGSSRRLKHSLLYGQEGEQLVCYDNERGKGDHRHVAGKEEPYAFTTVEKLIEDFTTDVRRARGGP